MTTVGALRAAVRSALATSHWPVDPREANLLIGRALGLSEVELLASPELSVAPRDEAAVNALVRRRVAGEPVAYLFGEREFYGRSFAVDSRVLIPRPETEHLVEAVLGLDLQPSARVLDVGTGSGCIALTLALERPELSVVGSDIDLGALAVAAWNRRRLGLDRRVPLAAFDLLDGLQPGAIDAVDAIVCNPPYVSASDPELSDTVRAFEPARALFAAEGGLACYRRLLDAGLMAPSGATFVLELGAGQLEAVRGIAGPGYTTRNVVSDYAGHPRVLVLRRA